MTFWLLVFSLFYCQLGSTPTVKLLIYIFLTLDIVSGLVYPSDVEIIYLFICRNLWQLGEYSNMKIMEWTSHLSDKFENDVQSQKNIYGKFYNRSVLVEKGIKKSDFSVPSARITITLPLQLAIFLLFLSPLLFIAQSLSLFHSLMSIITNLSHTPF